LTSYMPNTLTTIYGVDPSRKSKLSPLGQANIAFQVSRVPEVDTVLRELMK